MNPLVQSIRSIFQNCIAIVEAKNADYSSQANPFANFEHCERLHVPAHVGILIRVQDKIARLENLLSIGAAAPKVQDETIDDTIDDAINYLAILRAKRKTPGS